MALIFTWSSLATLAPPGDMSNLDKVAHSVEYGVLGWLLARAWGAGSRGRFPAWILAAVCGAGVGALDERYQLGVGRNCSLGDWLTDVIAVLVLAWVTLWIRDRGARAEPESST